MDVVKMRQPLVLKRIEQAIKKNRVAHAYLFDGKKGSGKKEMALLFAQMLLCTGAGNPCAACNECMRVLHRNHPDVHLIETDGSAIKIEQVRHLQKEFQYRGVEAQQKIYIIDQVETLTTQAANSLLKFLEEPYAGTIAILLTEQKQRILPTIISRCQEVKFAPPPLRLLIDTLSPSYGEALAVLASHIKPDMEEATMLCQSDWFADLRGIVIQLTEELQYSSLQKLFIVQDKWLAIAKEKELFDIGLEMLLLWYKDVLFCKLNLEHQYIYQDQLDKLKAQAANISVGQVTKSLEDILEAKKRIYSNVNTQLLLEQVMLGLWEG